MSFTFAGRETEQVYYAITVNISETGVSFYTVCEAEVGDKIVIGTIKGVQCTAGSVRWVRRIDNIFRVGVECAKLRPV